MFDTLATPGVLYFLERDKTKSALTLLWDLAHKYVIKDHVRFYASSDLIRLLKAVGFTNVRIEKRVRKLMWKGKLYTNIMLLTASKL